MDDFSSHLTMLLVPAAPGLELDHLKTDDQRIAIALRSTAPAAPCPLCTNPSAQVRSRYSRTLADLPWGAFSVRLHLLVRRFACRGKTCPRRIFTQRLPTIAAPYARRTTRLTEAARGIGFEASAQAGSRIAARLKMPASGSTVLRTMRRTPELPRSTPRVLGVDDFAFRRGRTYGTILVDLEKHCPVELLADRRSETLEKWLNEHPGVEYITRDRGGAYAEGARKGAPDAVQIADRWHLLQNMTEALERVLSREHRALRAAARDTSVASATEATPSAQALASASPAEPALPAPTATRARQLSAQRRQRRLDSYTGVVELYRQGVKHRAIAQRVGVSPRTVRRWLQADSFPERATCPTRPSQFDAFAPYLKARWKAGCHNASQLWRELAAQGFTGANSSVRRYLSRFRAKLPASCRGVDTSASAPTLAVPSVRSATWMLLKPKEELEPEQQVFVETLCERCPAVKTAQELALSFFSLVRDRAASGLEAWLNKVSESALPDLKSFIAGLMKDRAAVMAAVSYEWSNAQVEGQVNRLKLIKRSMYGRANFDLLRRRVLYAN